MQNQAEPNLITIFSAAPARLGKTNSPPRLFVCLFFFCNKKYKLVLVCARNAGIDFEWKTNLLWLSLLRCLKILLIFAGFNAEAVLSSSTFCCVCVCLERSIFVRSVNFFLGSCTTSLLLVGEKIPPNNFFRNKL